MISLYSGTPGSGKSLHVADRVRWAVRAGRPVLCNFDVDPAVLGRSRYDRFFHYWDNQALSPDRLVRFSREYFGGGPVREDRILLVIDEAQLLFNARDWGVHGRERWVSFFTQHRKFGYSVILVAQFDRMLDRQLRSLIEYEFVHRKVSNFGWRGLLLSALLLSPRLFVSVKVWYPMKEKVGSEFFRFRRRNARLYDTYADFAPPSQAPGCGGGGGGDLQPQPGVREGGLVQGVVEGAVREASQGAVPEGPGASPEGPGSG